MDAIMFLKGIVLFYSYERYVLSHMGRSYFLFVQLLCLLYL
jgi:hypothetical protein